MEADTALTRDVVACLRRGLPSRPANAKLDHHSFVSLEEGPNVFEHMSSTVVSQHAEVLGGFVTTHPTGPISAIELGRCLASLDYQENYGVSGLERAACRKIYYREQPQNIRLAWTWALKLAMKS